MKPNELASGLVKIYGDNLKAVVLYGSAVGRDFSKEFSDYNVFCVLQNPAPAELAKCNKLVRKWTKKGNPAPLFFGPKHIETSLDVFPLEFWDIKGRRQILAGKDPVEGITIDPKNLRHQCESELKGKLLHLRSFYAVHCDRPKEVARMTVKSFSTLTAAFRGILRLKGKEPPSDMRSLIEMLAVETGVNAQIFLDIIEIRLGGSLLPRRGDALCAFEQYLTELDAIAKYVDGL